MDLFLLLRIVDAIHRDKNIDKEIVFEGIEAAIVTAAKKHYGEEEDIQVKIDPRTGLISGTHNGVEMAPQSSTSGSASFLAFKQVMIQKIREAERDHLYNEYDELRGQLVTGADPALMKAARPPSRCPTLRRYSPAASKSPARRTTSTSACGRRFTRSLVKPGSRVKVILSRTKPHLVPRCSNRRSPRFPKA